MTTEPASMATPPTCPQCHSENVDGEVDYFDIEGNWCYDCGWSGGARLFNMVATRQLTPAPCAPQPGNGGV
jgi:hypothetical protein